MELGICMRDLPVQEVVELGRFAHNNGYSSIYLPETGNRTAEGGLSGRSPWISLAAMFAETTDVGGAVGVAAAPFRSLPHLALSAATLNEQSEGRFTLASECLTVKLPIVWEFRSQRRRCGGLRWHAMS